ncbi:hypothetical protein [Variovorax atrisoli]|uniref:hypothetical protein n=1 Tax=Variovorax atrisoli TaxID=3394203 RepID=UPI0013DE983B|nr:hypothetical protein [Variovorax sp. 369]
MKKQQRMPVGSPLADCADALVEIESVGLLRLAPRLALIATECSGAETEAPGKCLHAGAFTRLRRAHVDHPDRGVALAHGNYSLVM